MHAFAYIVKFVDNAVGLTECDCQQHIGNFKPDLNLKLEISA